MPTYTYDIPPESVGPFGWVTLGGVSRLFQRSATDHAASLGYTSDWYTDTGTGWVSRHNYIDVRSPITSDAPVKLSTWIADMKRVRSLRVYELEDQETDEILARGSTDWVFVNRDKNSISRIPDDVKQNYLSERPAGVEDAERHSIEVGEPPTDAFELKNQVVFRDLDEFGHVNNTVFVDYAEELIMQYITDFGKSTGFSSIEREPFITEFHLKYLDEAHWMDSIRMKLWPVNSDDNGKKSINFIFEKAPEQMPISKGVVKLNRCSELNWK